MHLRRTGPLVVFFAWALGNSAQADETTRLARTLLDELIAVDTSNPPGNEELAARLVAARLRAAGIEPVLVPFAPGRANLVARLRGDGARRPLLLVAHLDVVGAAGQPWTVPPFQVTERDGWLHGRGVTDDKGFAAMSVALLIELARTQSQLHRDLIVVLTGDEESEGAGIRYLLEQRRDLIGDAELALNEGGSIVLDRAGRVRLVSVGCAEKTFADFTFVARGVGGHSSVPSDDNAIYRLARALDRLAGLSFPPRLSPAVRESLRAGASMQPEPLARAMRVVAAQRGDVVAPDLLATMDRHPLVRALIRTTCVATMLTGGTRDNALPVEARATVNCRIMPGDSVAAVHETLQRLAAGLADVGIDFPVVVSPEVPAQGLVRAAIERATRVVFGDVPVSARVALGASDSRHLRQAGIAAYGIDVLARPDVLTRSQHGPDEGAPAASFPLGVAFLREIVRGLAL
jgi:acetylornithine deacetylase/succinyl-diaminopimelate desuccinylase-like protein